MHHLNRYAIVTDVLSQAQKKRVMDYVCGVCIDSDTLMSRKGSLHVPPI